MAEQLVEDLGPHGATQIGVAQTKRPWTLDVDALIISVAPDDLGNVGTAVREQFPELPWGHLVDRPPTTARPTLLRDTRVSVLVVAVTSRLPEGRSTVRSSVDAALAGLSFAAGAGARRVAMPLIGEAHTVTALTELGRALAIALIDDDETISRLDHLIVADPGTTAVDAFRYGWLDATNERYLLRQSDSVQALLALAAQISYERYDEPSTLWLAALRQAADVGAYGGVATPVLDELVHRAAASTATVYLESLPSASWTNGGGQSSTSGLPPMLMAARLIARRLHSDTIHRRHVLAAAALSDDPLLLDATGVFAPTLRQMLRRAIRKAVPSESSTEWDAILLDESDDAEPDVLGRRLDADLVDPSERIPLERDHLGMGTYVRMLASVIADENTPVPLSIGLFGEWGSGKSYFMGLLREQIEQLRRRPHDGYVDEIEQIGFNAWHYADTNLWASLGNEIFEHLAGVHDGDKDRRDTLRAELTEKLDARRSLETATQQAQTRSAQLREELAEARAERRVSLRDLAQAVNRSDELDTAWKRLGVDDELEQADLVAREMHGAARDVGTLRAALRGVRGIRLAALVGVSVLLVALALVSPDDVRMWLARSGVAGLGIGLTYLGVLVGRVRLGVRTLTSLATAAQDESVRKERGALNEAIAKEKVLATQLDEVVARAGEIGRELADLAPGRRLYGFLSERAGSDDYRAGLGLVSTIRRDLQQLIRLMREWAHDAESPRPVRRIVLYIDDLDRCSPKQVVDVLQAVHLLLALDLFVVVVGVDPRWLLRSLQTSYSETLGSESFAGADRADTTWTATPLDYLEKIFNLPFVLPGMTSAGFETLVRGLTAPRDETPLLDPVAATTTPRPTPAASSPSTTPDPMPVEQGSRVYAIEHGHASRGRDLTEHELRLLSSLGPLVETPRETKRLLNLYRTLRSTRDLGTASDFLGADGDGEYQAVCILLGVLSARPSLMPALLWAPSAADIAGGMCHRLPESPWAGVVAGLRPDGDRNALGPLTRDEAIDWSWVCERLAPADELIRLDRIAAFQRWGPRIARFSFVLSPLARS